MRRSWWDDDCMTPPSYPLRPSGGRGRGPARSAGRVRWVSADALESPTSPQPSPPPGAARGGLRFSDDGAGAVGGGPPPPPPPPALSQPTLPPPDPARPPA